MYWIGSLVVLSLLALAGAREVPEPNAGVGCDMSLSKKTCLNTNGCYWCASTTYAGQRSVCVDEVQAMQLPLWVYKCSHKTAPALEEELVVEPSQSGCDNPRTEDECLDNPACVWCSSGFGPAQEHCMSAEQAMYIPAGIVTCKAKKDDLAQTLQAGADPQPGAGCTNFMEKKACLHSAACHWCENKFSPGIGARCVEDTEAKFLPDTFFKCKKGKDPKPAPAPAPESDTDNDAVLNVAKPKPEPAPTPAPAPTCTDAKDKKACKHIADCAWCENLFNVNGSVCLDATSAAYIPATVFKCKAGKGSATLSATSAPAPADPCKDAVDAPSCEDTTGCAWCENQFDATSDKCLNAAAAVFMPPTVFKCKAAKQVTLGAVVEVTPAADPCTDAVDRASCKDVAGCAWCESLFNPMGSRCMDAAKAQFIPASVFKCKASKKSPALSADPEPTPSPNPCKVATDSASCQAIDGCAWCDNLFSPALKSKCLKSSKAQFLPPAVYKCTATAQTVAGLKNPAPTPTPAADPCKDAMDRKSCKAIDGCAWCENQFNPTLGSLCMDAAHSAFIPATVFKCKAAKKHDSVEAVGPVDSTPGPQPGAMCGSSMDKKGCLNNPDCFWCTSSFGPAMTSGHCYNEMEAKYLPAYMYKCKAATKATTNDAADPTPGPQPGAMCGSSMDKKGCLKNPGCFWCTSSFGPAMTSGHCYNEMEAKFLPAYMYKCKAAKQQEVFQQEEEDDNENTSMLQMVKDLFAVFGKSGGDAPSPYAPPTPGAGCTSAMDKDSCLDQKDCYWCDNKFTPGTGARCMDEASAKFLPDIVFKCKKAKHKKDSPARKIVSF